MPDEYKALRSPERQEQIRMAWQWRQHGAMAATVHYIASLAEPTHVLGECFEMALTGGWFNSFGFWVCILSCRGMRYVTGCIQGCGSLMN